MLDESVKDFFRGIAFNARAFTGLILICLLFIIVFIIPGIYLSVKKGNNLKIIVSISISDFSNSFMIYFILIF